MQTVEDIKAMGGEAVVNGENVADWDGAQRLVRQAVDEFGDLHVLVNNAGILRDRVIINMTEAEWDAVVQVHLKGHFCPTRHAAAYWREQTKAGKAVNASIVHTSSTSGLFSNPGQANYDAAKSGIATLSQICAKELSRYGVRSNTIAPARAHPAHRGDARSVGRGQGARRRLRRVGPGERVAVRRVPRDRGLPVHRRDVHGAGRDGATRAVVVDRRERIDKDDRWTVAELAAEAASLAPPPEAAVATRPRSRLSYLSACWAMLAPNVGPEMIRPTPLLGNRSSPYRPKNVRHRNTSGPPDAEKQISGWGLLGRAS